MIKKTNSWAPATEWVDAFTRVKAVEVEGKLAHEYYCYSWLTSVYWEMGDRPCIDPCFRYEEWFENTISTLMEYEVKRDLIKIRSFGYMSVVFADFGGTVSVLAGNDSDLILLDFFAGTKNLDVIYQDFVNNRYDYAINKLSAIARLKSTE